MHKILRVTDDRTRMGLETIELVSRRLVPGDDAKFSPAPFDLDRRSGFQNLIENLVNIFPQLRGRDLHAQKTTPEAVVRQCL